MRFVSVSYGFVNSIPQLISKSQEHKHVKNRRVMKTRP